MSQYDSYIICTSPRSGSTLLCRMLQATGVAGRPDSWFHHPDVRVWQRDFGLPETSSLQATIDAAQTAGRAGTKLFGLRVQQHSFDYAMAQFHKLRPDHTSDHACLAKCFGRILYVHLERHDTLAQAVSYIRASQSGLWHRNADGSELERLSAPQTPRYDEDAITQQVQSFGAQNAAWRDWFQRQQIEPVRMNYTALSNDPSAAVINVLTALGVSYDPEQLVLPTAKLGDAVNDDWITRYRKSHPRP